MPQETALNTSSFLLIGKTRGRDVSGRDVYEEIEEAREIPGKGCFVRHTIKETLTDRSSSKIVIEEFVPGITIICSGVSSDGIGGINYDLELVDSNSKEAKEAKPLDYFVSQLNKKEEPAKPRIELANEEPDHGNTKPVKGK